MDTSNHFATPVSHADAPMPPPPPPVRPQPQYTPPYAAGPQGSNPGTRKRGGKGCLIAALVVVGVMLMLGLLMVVGVALALAEDDGMSPPGLAQGEYGRDDVPEMREVWSTGQGEVKAVRIPLHGMIMLDGSGMGRPGSVGSALAALQSIRRATHDTEVKALILEINSGGGGITASDILYKALKTFKAQDPDRVVVSIFGDVGASGAYYIALASDAILAHPTTMTGSIGVLLKSYNAQGLAEKIGIKDVTIKSGDNKDILNPLSELSDAQHAMLQGIVDQLHKRFVTLVSEERGLPEEQVLLLADGRIFLSEEAIEDGLIDGLGYASDAIESAAELLGVSDLKVYRYEPGFSLSDLLRTPGLLGRMGLDLRNDARAQYRWEL